MNEKKKWDPRVQDWVGSYEAIEQPEKRWDWSVAVFIIVLILVVVGLGTAFTIAAGEEGAVSDPTGSSLKPSEPSPAASSAYDAFDVERGSALSAVAVVASEPDPAVGQPRIAGQFSSTEFITRCDITDFELVTYSTRALARKAVESSEHGAAWARVEYAEPDWHDKFVVAIVTAVCP